MCTTPAIAALRKHFPGVEVGALVNSYNAEVLRGNPDVDRVFVYQKLKHAGSLAIRAMALCERFLLIVRLRRWKPGVTILAKASYDRHGLNFARMIGAKNVIGFVPEPRSMFRRLPDIQLQPPDFTACHEVEAVAKLLTPLGITEAMGALRIFPDLETVVEINKRLPPARRRVALHISAREPGRRWGLDNFIRLTKHILQTQPDTQILLLWSPGHADDLRHPGDDESAEQLINAVSNNRLIPMPTDNLTELIAALSVCHNFLGADGGALHLAVALNKELIALFENRADKLKHWYPWGCKSQILHSLNQNDPNVSQVRLSQVTESFDKLGR